mgnify:CR=1 FL=1
MIRVCLVDDQTLVRQGIRSLLALDDGIEVVAEAADGHEALAMIAKHHPEVVLADAQMPGMGGAMDLCVGAKHCIICMEHTAKGNPKIFEKCRLPLTASHCVNKIITEMCVLEVTENGLVMTEINPEFTVEQVKAATAAPITVAENLKSMID